MVFVLQETRHSGGFIVSESANLYRSRDQGTFVNSGTVDLVVQAGLVLALAAETATGATITATVGNTGNGVMSALIFGASAVTGVFTIKMLTATTFNVIAPNGTLLAPGVTGAAYSGGELGFTLTAGGTAFVAGDSFTINVPAANMQYIPWVNAGPAIACMWNTDIIAAGTTGRVTVLSRAAEVNGAELTWDPSISGSGSFMSLQALAASQLKVQGIIVR